MSETRLTSAVQAAALDKLRILNANYGARFFRSGQVGQGITRFTPEQVRYTSERLETLLNLCGYA